MKYGIYIDGDLASHVAKPDSLVIDGDTFQARFPGLMQINQDYRKFLWTSIPAEREWTSTARFMDYIAMDVIEFCLQKLEGGGEKDNWRLYLWFSGCGGTSEVSSMLGAHWADLWYTRRRIDVHANIFVPQGFLPHDDQPTFEWPQFVAIPGYSYASFHPSGECWTESKFDIDVAVGDALDIPLEEFVQNLDQTYGELLGDEKCRCQLCMPDFKPSAA